MIIKLLWTTTKMFLLGSDIYFFVEKNARIKSKRKYRIFCFVLFKMSSPCSI